jgi:hypothetical protein
VLNEMLWMVRTGAPWRDRPEHDGPWTTAHERLRQWTADGTWDKFLDTLRLILRQFTEDDGDNLVDHDGDPAAMRYITGGGPTTRPPS